MLNKLVSFFLISAVLGVAVSYGKFYLFHLSLIILYIYLLIHYSNIDNIIKVFLTTNKMHYMFYFIIMWYLLSYFWIFEEGFISYYKYLFYLFNGITVSLVIVYYSTSKERLNKLYKILSIIFVIELILSLMEIHPDFRLPISPNSELLHYFNRDGNIKPELTMPTGFNWNQNNLAATMTLILPFSLFLKNIFLRFILSISIIILIFNTFSFGAFLSVMFILFIYFVYYKKMYFQILLILIFLFFSFDFYKQYLPNSLSNKIEYIEEYTYKFIMEDGDSKGKITSSKSKRIGFKAINDSLEDENKLFTGLGAGQSSIAIKNGKNYHGIQSVHNFWYEQYGNGGAIFFLIFIAWYFLVIFKLLKIVKITKDKNISYFAKSSSLSLLGLILVSFVPSSMIYMFPLWILFGFSIAILNLHNRDLNE